MGLNELKRPLHIFTIVWGDQYVNWFQRALCRSLAWPKNKAALQHAKWTIFGQRDRDTQRIYEIATQVLPFHQIEMRDLIMNSPGQVNMLECMMQVMRRCLDDRAQMLTAPPDTVFADGTIDVLLNYGDQKDTCVAVSHPRVTPGILDDLCASPLPNGQLVTLALEKYPHAAWVQSNGDLPVTGSHVGGIRWLSMGARLWAVQHRLPTIYLSNFTDDDRKYFTRTYMGQPRQYGMWDHEWPGDLVIPQQRQRTIGSSDAAFIFEVTNPWSNAPPLRLNDMIEPDSFHRAEYHNRINRCYFSVFRGE